MGRSRGRKLGRNCEWGSACWTWVGLVHGDDVVEECGGRPVAYLVVQGSEGFWAEGVIMGGCGDAGIIGVLGEVCLGRGEGLGGSCEVGA